MKNVIGVVDRGSVRQRHAVGLLVVVTANFLLLTADVIRAQQPRPTFRSGVDLVTVEVQVVDRDGRPIPTLGLADFEVKIDGRKRNVVSATLVDYDPAIREEALKKAPPSLATYLNKPRDRMFIIAVDEASLKPGDAKVAMTAAKKFIDTLHPTDYVALYKYPIISRDLNVTHGHAEVKSALDKVAGVYSPIRSQYRAPAVGDRRHHGRRCGRPGAGRPARVRPDRSALRPGDEEHDPRRGAGAVDDRGDRCGHARARRAAAARRAGPRRRTQDAHHHQRRALHDRSHRRPSRHLVVDDLPRQGSGRRQYQPVRRAPRCERLHGPERAGSARARSGRSAAVRPPGRDGETFGLGLQQLAGTAGGGYIKVQAGTPDYAFARVLKETAAYYLLAVEPDARDRDGRLHFLRTTVKAKGALVRSRSHVFIPKAGGG